MFVCSTYRTYVNVSGCQRDFCIRDCETPFLLLKYQIHTRVSVSGSAHNTTPAGFTHHVNKCIFIDAFSSGQPLKLAVIFKS